MMMTHNPPTNYLPTTYKLTYYVQKDLQKHEKKEDKKTNI